MVPLREQPSHDSPGQMRLPRQRFRRRQTVRRKPLGALHGEQPVEITVLVAVERDPERPLRAIAARQAGRALEPGHEGRIPAETVELKIHEGPVREIGLGSRREHARRGARRHTRYVAAIQNEHRAAAPGQLVRHGKTDDSPADHDHLAAGRQGRHAARLPSHASTWSRNMRVALTGSS